MFFNVGFLAEKMSSGRRSLRGLKLSGTTISRCSVTQPEELRAPSATSHGTAPSDRGDTARLTGTERDLAIEKHAHNRQLRLSSVLVAEISLWDRGSLTDDQRIQMT